MSSKALLSLFHFACHSRLCIYISAFIYESIAGRVRQNSIMFARTKSATEGVKTEIKSPAKPRQDEQPRLGSDSSPIIHMNDDSRSLASLEFFYSGYLKQLFLECFT